MGVCRISMVKMDTVGKHFPKKRETMSEYEALENAYLDGMREILSEIAARRYLEIGGMRSNNPHIRKASEESSYAIQRLHSSLNETQHKLYGRMEEAMNTEQGLEEEEAFVVGFLEGYRFIKELQRSGGGLTLV
ncbi:hypothetical protein BK133_21235 [Paenibacillus sp. FSL H8-0548]|uniref:DUF6809 family protein n=1 Tax=Paenibacillus sp. FSL H8-0548 TaxID=1920422 RepID=UPI00096CCD83|nr:DUF6809 family protein [Paenibacillus sp. FSL H8-0548]OMF25617.1 hypothetical protein BK133_21235 [Paenibacillus sp. FSL H8-0548]